jgi:hypothetical protein
VDFLCLGGVNSGGWMHDFVVRFRLVPLRWMGSMVRLSERTSWNSVTAIAW